MNTTSNNYYKVGGSLDRDAPSYGVRQADEDFYQALKVGEFCYVLNSRQMGKSSLRVRTVARLEAEGIACSQIDITSIGSREIRASEWYWGVVRRLARSFKMSIDLKTWWQERAEASPVDRLSQFIEEVLLVEVQSSIAIFIDEIDSILNLDFKDDFFALIRTCYNQRAENPEYRRLTFALLGVATPSDLIQDKSRTPFNIGRSIDLRGLQLHEAEPLAQGLQGKAEDAIAVLKSILDWTGGQPFLTQKICQFVQSETDWISAGQEAERVRSLVQSRVIENWEGQDEPEHLRTIQNRVTRENDRKGQLLGLYQQVLEQGAIPATASEEQIQLRLSGLVVEDQGRLRSHNQIYAAVFDQAWAERILAELRPYAEAIAIWIKSGGQDDSRLLRGKALEEAQQWAVDKRLGEQDNRFLSASEQAEKRVMIEENQILSEANDKVKKRLMLATGLLSITIAGSVISGIWAGNEVNQAKDKAVVAQQLRTIAETNTKEAEVKTNNALSQEKAAKEKEKEAKAGLEVAQTKLRIAQIQFKVAEQSLQTANQKVNRAKQELESAQQKAQKQITNAGVEVAAAREKVRLAEEEQKQAEVNLKFARGEVLKAKDELTQVTQRLVEARESVRQLVATVNETVNFDTTATGTRVTLRGDGTQFVSGYKKMRVSARNLGISENELLQIETNIQNDSISFNATYSKSEEAVLERYDTFSKTAIQLGIELAQLEKIPESKRSRVEQGRISVLLKLRRDLVEQFNQFVSNTLWLSTDSINSQLLDLEKQDALRSNLRDLNAALFYPLILEDRLELLIVTPDSPILRRTVFIKKDKLIQYVIAFRQELERYYHLQQDIMKISQKIYSLLIKPLEQDLQQAGIQTIIYAPDAFLREIPLSALHDGKKWLIENYAVNNITALSLTKLKPYSNLNPRVLAGATTKSIKTLINDREVQFNPLTFTSDEVDNIRKIIPNTKIFADEDFTPKNVFSNPKEYDIIHLATHAMFNAENPEDSFILFGNGERLSFNDINSLDLTGVDLIVLSASQTGMGGRRNGEEILGLGYTFQSRGARAVIASLWSIDDRATRELMSEFYMALRQGKSKVQALRQAQLKTLYKAISPSYWASFILIGSGF